MNIGTAFPSKYLKASDIPEDHPVTVQIDRVEMEDIGAKGKREIKPVLYFVKKEKGMVLNKTNAGVISKAYGEETESWRLKLITIVSTETEFAGEIVSCLRLRIPRPAATPTHNNNGQAAPARTMAERGQQIREREPAEQPFGEESEFTEDSIPF